jgi:hypothetical protein
LHIARKREFNGLPGQSFCFAVEQCLKGTRCGVARSLGLASWISGLAFLETR